MHVIAFLVLAASVSFANRLERSARTSKRIGQTVRNETPGSPRAEFLKSAEALHARVEQLRRRKEIPLMMILANAAPLDAATLDYFTNHHPVMTAEVAGNFVLGLAELEARLALRFGVDGERVAREIDLLFELARLNLGGLTSASIEELLAKSPSTLGSAFQDVFINEVRKLPLPRTELPDAAVIRSSYANLARHINRALIKSWEVLAGRPQSAAARAWLHASLPELVIEDAVETMMVRPPAPPILIPDPDSVRELVIQQGCQQFFEYAEDLPPELPLTKAELDGR